MTTKLLRSLGILLAVLCFGMGTAWAQTGTIEGQVIDAQTQKPLINANVFIPSIQRGAATDISGNFSIDDIPYGTYQLRIQYIGYKTKTTTVTVDQETVTVNIALQPAASSLDELVVTAFGSQAEKRSVAYSQQTVEAEKLTIASNSNIKSSLAGKIAGVQMLGQAGAKLGAGGSIRIRGELSLTDFVNEPLYVVDGVPVEDPNVVNMNNVAEITVLKGASAAALYGQRGANGVVLITTQSADAGGISIDFASSFYFQQVTNLPEYQNLYGQGYNGVGLYKNGGEMQMFHYDPALHPEYFKPMDGSLFIHNSLADASWGARMDGKGPLGEFKYAAWYTWWPDSPYYGQEVPFDPHPNNIKNFWDDAWKTKNSIAINVHQERFSGRVSYANLRQGGLLPYTDLTKHYFAGSFGFDVNEDFHVEADFNYTTETINGQVRADGYSNNTTGSFNQWFGRQLSMKKMNELQGLRTPSGYYTSWNWWGPITYSLGWRNQQIERGRDFMKPGFWFNPFTWQKQFDRLHQNDDLILSFSGSYQLNDQFELVAQASTYKIDQADEFKIPYSIERSSGHTLYVDYVNSFGVANYEETSNNYSVRLKYRSNFGDITVDGFVGGNIWAQHAQYNATWMDRYAAVGGGLIIPNVYLFSNSREDLTPTSTSWQQRVYSMFGKVTVGYKDYLYLNATYRQDWSSALPEENNGYGYPSVGVSFVFSELVDVDFLTYGRLKASWAQVGDDVGAEAIIQSYALSDIAYTNPATGQAIPLMFTSNTLIDPNIQPALQTSWEVGGDFRFFDGRVGLHVTYYDTKRNNEIIPISLSATTGRTSYLTNAGLTERTGWEIALDGYILRTNNFQWNMLVNFAAGETIVKTLPEGMPELVLGYLDAFAFTYLTQIEGKEWGQLRGTAIARTKAGGFIKTGSGLQKVNPGTKILGDDGLYVTDANHYFGSILPDFTGGVVNSIAYKNFTLSFAIDFQSGGRFFSLSEMWGQHTGLMAETAKINDRGVQVRKPVSEGGGVHVVGVTQVGVTQVGVDDAGNPIMKPVYESVDTYINANAYYTQWYANKLAEPFIHDASYVKLRSAKIGYTLPSELFGGVIKRATISLVGRNLWLIWTNNPYNWDPSTISNSGAAESGQLPGTRSFGFNLNITF